MRRPRIARPSRGTIATAQALYRDGSSYANYPSYKANDVYAPSLAALGAANLVDPTLASGTKQGYVFRILAAGPSGFSALATPLVPGKTGNRAFFVDESGVIRFTADGTVPTAQSTPLGG